MESTSVVAEIVRRVAEREGVDPVDLDESLYDVIEADALDALTNGARNRQPQATLRIGFTYYGYAVTVDGSGQVRVREQPAAGETDGSTGEGTGDA